MKKNANTCDMNTSGLRDFKLRPLKIYPVLQNNFTIHMIFAETYF